MIKTAIVIVPLLTVETSPSINNTKQAANLDTLLSEGYRIKIVNDVLYHNVVFAHYVLEKEE